MGEMDEDLFYFDEAVGNTFDELGRFLQKARWRIC
jgi:hypothetical protein